MVRRWIKGAIAAAALAGMAVPALATESSAVGFWLMSNGKVTIKVTQCGDGVCGNIFALKYPNGRDGKPKVDNHNPNPALRTRSVIGISILTAKPAGPNVWKGTIYNSDDGHSYSSTFSLDGNTMKVKACVSIFCKKIIFTRVN